MARMVPFPMLPTESSAERRFYEWFLEQLPDEYVVYHSVDWVLRGPRGADEGEADFVITHPEDGLLVLEVKGGSVTFDPDTGAWQQSGRTGPHRMDEDPFEQAKAEQHAVVKILRAQPDWERWRPSYGYAVGFPDGRYEAPAHPGAPVDIVIDRDDAGRLADRVREVMRHWRRPGRRFGAEGMDAVARAFGYRVEIRTPLGVAFDLDDRRIVELTDDQAWVLAFVLNRTRAAVTGPAGSGKTILAVSVTRKLAETGHRTLLTCFNRALAGYLRAQVAGTPGVDVVHFHELCWNLAAEAGLSLPAELELPDNSPFFTDELPDLLERAARALGPRYDAIVVDEAQDFRDHWWTALLALHAEPDAGPLYLFGDDNQNLYGGGALPVEDEAKLPPLTRNHRNTVAIQEFVSVFYRGTEPAISAGPEGRPVEVIGYRDADELARTLGVVVRTLVEQEKVPLEEIVVLTPSRTARSELRRRGEAGGYRLTERPEAGALLATTVHAFKGLERQVVILAEVEDRHRDRLADYLYCGATRARAHLIVLAEEDLARDLRSMTGASGPPR